MVPYEFFDHLYPFEFGVNEENCLGLIDKCAEIGIELFVIDDGWMPGRTNDRSGLGDWSADPERFPHGMSAVSEKCHEKGMMFGLWVEPEMGDRLARRSDRPLAPGLPQMGYEPVCV